MPSPSPEQGTHGVHGRAAEGVVTEVVRAWGQLERLDAAAGADGDDDRAVRALGFGARFAERGPDGSGLLLGLLETLLEVGEVLVRVGHDRIVAFGVRGACSNQHNVCMVKPLVTREMRERARGAPSNWLHVVDPAYDTTAGVPAEAVIGRYLVDARGEITDQYVANPRYVPRDTSFENELESLMYLVHRGYADKKDLVDAVLVAELVLPADPTRELRGHLVTRGDVVDAFASERALPGDWPQHWQRFRGVELAVVIDAMRTPVTVLVSAQGGVRFEIPGELLVDGLRLVAAR